MITEYVKGKPYFINTQTKINAFPYLNENVICDVLIIGGGIDGAITNYFFSNAGINTILIDKNRFGYGNTSCATCLLEYQLDEHANNLTKFFTKKQLVEVYKIGLKSLEDIDKIINKIGNNCHYFKRDTLMFSQKEGDIDELKQEYDFRKENGFDVEFLHEGNNPFPFKIMAGILAKNGGAEFNPYLFTNQMIENSPKKFSRCYEHTEATILQKTADGIKVITQYGIQILAKKVILATGYNTKLLGKQKFCNKFISYTIVTQPLKNLPWQNSTLLQDNAMPYHYARISPDNRVIFGGEDVPFKNDTINLRTAQKKYNALEKTLCQLLQVQKINIEYKFCGAFSATSNNLAVIGKTTSPNIWVNLGYGANGIIYSVFGAQLLLNIYYNKYNKFLKLFAPTRKLP
ncbi:MAG: FAD-dependent oxidoreductase [Clostridia bacterium]